MIDIACVRQKEALGLGHVVLRSRELVGLSVAVVLSDDVRIPGARLRQLLDIHDFSGLRWSP